MMDMFKNETSMLKNQIKRAAEWIVQEEEAITTAKKDLVQRQEALDKSKADLSTLMQQNGFDRIILDNGLSPKAKNSIKYYKTADDDLFFDWLNNNNLGGIINPYVHFQTMQAALSEFEQQGGIIDKNLINKIEVPSVVMYDKSKYLQSINPEWSGSRDSAGNDAEA